MTPLSAPLALASTDVLFRPIAASSTSSVQSVEYREPYVCHTLTRYFSTFVRFPSTFPATGSCVQ